MAKAAVLESSSANNFPFGKVQSDVKMKRKTPSELRGEQLKRKNATEDLAPFLFSERITYGANDGLKKHESSKLPKFISTRVNEVYPVKKSSERCRMLYGKEKAEEHPTANKTSSGPTGFTSNLPAKGNSSMSCGKANSAKILECSDSSAKENCDQGFRKIEKCGQNALRNVVELHCGNDKTCDSANIDMQKALKGLIARDIPATSGSSDGFPRKHGDLPQISTSSLRSEFHIPGHRSPLDFTLKNTLRLVSSSSVKWCHRVSSSPTLIDISQLSTQFCCNKDQKIGCTSGLSEAAEVMYSKALRSWVYPQSSLPASIISAMALSAVREEKDFLSRRQREWEDSFRNLYYMVRKNMCDIFYVYTAQFVVLFIGGNFSGNKRSCNAYLSQSTRGLRSLLKKHEICFSMPLCHVEIEQAAEVDLVELSEIEKRNLGQTFHLDPSSDMDNSPQSLLAFIGNKNVHALYDFLLNYRLFLNSFTAVDVPVIYAPVPFQNASLCVPEVRCKEMKRADVFPSSNASDTENNEASLGSSMAGICYSIEIKDTILPPWITSGICAAMSSKGQSFESSFTTEPLSSGLNVALDCICHKSDPSTESSRPLPGSGEAFGIPEVVATPILRSASLRRLKYSNDSYVAYATPI